MFYTGAVKTVDNEEEEEVFSKSLSIENTLPVNPPTTAVIILFVSFQNERGLHVP